MLPSFFSWGWKRIHFLNHSVLFKILDDGQSQKPSHINLYQFGTIWCVYRSNLYCLEWPHTWRIELPPCMSSGTDLVYSSCSNWGEWSFTSWTYTVTRTSEDRLGVPMSRACTTKLMGRTFIPRPVISSADVISCSKSTCVAGFSTPRTGSMVKLLYGSPRTIEYCSWLLFVPGQGEET